MAPLSLIHDGLSQSLCKAGDGGYDTVIMESIKYIYWQDNDQWLGYLQDYPDYWTQGDSLKDLQAYLRDLFRDLTSGEIPGVRLASDVYGPSM